MNDIIGRTAEDVQFWGTFKFLCTSYILFSLEWRMDRLLESACAVIFISLLVILYHSWQC